ncbi:MAG TPA: PIN domain-containing protein [Bacillales bacterium]|nr:PIN domain-containing protein [Bacillales bacterium]
MNSISFSPPPKVFLDTTVLCGALRKPEGLQSDLLEFAGTSVILQPIISQVCLLEFYRNALNGLGNLIYSDQEIRLFLNEYIDPILDGVSPVNSVVGRYSIETILRENRPIGEVLIELSGCTSEQARQIVEQQEMSEPLHQFDQNDFHVWVTAIQADCRYIVTSNTHRFPAKIGSIERIHPLDFYKLVSAEIE